MVIKLSNGREFKLSWMHSSHNFEVRPNSSALRIAIETDALNHGKRRTLCEVSETTGGDYKTLMLATVVLAKGDVFRRDTGRDRSFGRAIILLREPTVVPSAPALLTADEAVELWALYLQAATEPIVNRMNAGELTTVQAVETMRHRVQTALEGAGLSRAERVTIWNYV